MTTDACDASVTCSSDPQALRFIAFAVKPLIIINAATIEMDGMPIDEPLPARWLDSVLADANLAVGAGDWEAKSTPDGGRLTGRISRSAHDIVVRGRVAAELTLACSRCLRPAAVPVNAELSLLLQPVPRSELPQQLGLGGARGAARARSGGGESEHEFSAQEADLDVYDGECVVLDSFVREAILLDLPPFPLCSEACVGIRAAPSSSATALPDEPEPVDPRLAPLGALRAELQGRASKPSTSDHSAVADAARSAARSKVMLRSTTRRGLRKNKKKRKRR